MKKTIQIAAVGLLLLFFTSIIFSFFNLPFLSFKGICISGGVFMILSLLTGMLIARRKQFALLLFEATPLIFSGLLLILITAFSRSFQSLIITLTTASVLYFSAGILFGNYKRCSFSLKVAILLIPIFLVFFLVNPQLLNILGFAIAAISLLLGLGIRKNWQHRKLLYSSFLLLWMAVIFILSYFIIPHYAFYDRSSSVIINKKIDFKLKSINGIEISSEKLKGKVILFDFWFKRCGACFRQFSDIEKISENYSHTSDFKVYAVNTGYDSFKEVKDISKILQYTFPILYDTDTLLTNQLGIEAFPHNILLDKKGVIRFNHTGYSKDESRAYIKNMCEKIDELLHE